jgi:hypothetical protein
MVDEVGRWRVMKVGVKYGGDGSASVLTSQTSLTLILMELRSDLMLIESILMIRATLVDM